MAEESAAQSTNPPPAPVPTQGVTAAENLMRLGAALVVASFLVFEILFDDYFFFTGTLLVAAMVLAAVWIRHNRADAVWPIPYTWTLRVLGYTAGFLGAVELLEDLRNSRLYGFADFLGGIVLYAGAFLLFWGARQLADRSTS